MPKRKDIKKILIIGSGPIIIGQACEFDYSGAQACKALRTEGYEVVLVNSNPATIMTDPELAHRTYIEPLTKEYLEGIIAREKPDALLPTVGGQTALNLAVELSESGILEKYKVEMIGASLRAIKVAEDRLWFKDACRKIGLEVPASALVNNAKDALRLCDQLGFPLVIRPSFTLGGTGGSIAKAQSILGIVDQCGRGDFQADFAACILEPKPVFRDLDGAQRGANHLHFVFFEHAAFGEFDGQIQRGLSADGRQQGVRFFPRDDFLEIFFCERLDVGAMREFRVGHDSRRIRIDQHDFVSLRAQRLARLRTGVIKLASLADNDRA